MAVRAIDAALYLLAKDTEGSIFNKGVVSFNGRTFYKGNAVLNKLLHLAQNIYLAAKGRVLFDDALYAYDNGAVVPSVQEKYSFLQEKRAEQRAACDRLTPEDRAFLDEIYDIFSIAPLEELIALSHEDPAWRAKKDFFSKNDQKMDTLAMQTEYKERYADIISIMKSVN